MGAVFACVAGCRVLEVLTVDRVCENFGDRGFARAASAAKEIGVIDCVVCDLVDKGAGDMSLPDDLGKLARAMDAVEGFDLFIHEVLYHSIRHLGKLKIYTKT